MFVMNDMLNDPRVHREARAAVRVGYRVTVVATQSDQCHIERDSVDGYEIIRVRVPRFRVVYAIFRVFSRLYSLRWVISKIGVVLKEGMNLALGMAPGPEGPWRSAGPVSRLRRVKWVLMRGIGVLLSPLRVFRRRLGWLESFLQSGTTHGGPRAGLRIPQRLHDLAFFEEMLWTTLAMLRGVRSSDATVFHGNDLPTLPVTSWAAWLAGGAALYDSHELWVGMSPEWSSFFNAMARWVEGRYIRQMHAVVTVNDPIAEELCKRYRIARPSVVMNCPERESPRFLDPRHSIRAKLGLAPHEPLILYQGRYAPWRGLEALIESSRYLSRGILVLRGYGSNEEDLRRRVAALGDGRRAFMVDPVPMTDLVSAAAEADIGVVPYTPCTLCNYYASPNKLFEYMMAGLALAVSNLPVLEKIVRDHDLGVVFDPAQPRHIAEQLDALTENPARLRVCRENAARVARERYHWNHEVQKLIQLYESLTGHQKTYTACSAGELSVPAERG